MSNIAVLQDDIYAVRADFEARSVDANIKFDTEAGFAIQLLGNNDYLAKVAMGNRQSLVDAVVNVAALGVSLNPAKRQAYLVPRDGRICLDISYMGLVDLALMGGSIRWAQAKVVRVGERFQLGGFDRPPVHEHDPFADDIGELRGVYVVVKTSDGDYLTHTMRIAEVFAIRDRSAAWKGYKAKGTKCPWVTDEAEMVKKTCIKQAYKTWPRSAALDRAVHYLNNDAGEGIDFTPADDEPPATEGRKPSVAMPQSRSRATASDVQDVEPRQPASAAQQPSTEGATPATTGELAWARNKVKALAPTRKAELEGMGYNIAGNLDGLTKGQFASLRKELV